MHDPDPLPPPPSAPFASLWRERFSLAKGLGREGEGEGRGGTRGGRKRGLDRVRTPRRPEATRTAARFPRAPTAIARQVSLNLKGIRGGSGSAGNARGIARKSEISGRTQPFVVLL